MAADIHQGEPVLEIGLELSKASDVVILLHGRGADPESLAWIADDLQDGRTCFWLPRAAGKRWYPETAFGPLERNEPDLSSALAVISGLIDRAEAAGIAKKHILLGGFSQGACLAAEYLARNPDRFGGLFVFSGALIGPPELRRELSGDLEDMPVLIGLGDQDPWIALDLAEQTARFFDLLGGWVDLRVYTGMGHTINQDEIAAVRRMIAAGKRNPKSSSSDRGRL